MTPQQLLKTIIRMAGESHKDEAIAYELSVPRHYVSVTRITLGLQSGTQLRANAIVADLKNYALSFQDIASRYKVTLVAVYRMATRNGIPTRGRVQSNMGGV